MNSLKLLFLLSCGLTMSSAYLFTAAAEERKEEMQSLDEAVAYSGQELKPKILILAKERKEFAPMLWSLSTLLVNAFHEDPSAEELPLDDNYFLKEGITLAEIHDLLSAVNSGNEKLATFLDSLSLSQLLKMLKASNYLNIHVGDTDITNAVAQSITKKTREASPDTSMPEATSFAALRDQEKLDQDLENLLKKTFDAERFKYIKSGPTLFNTSLVERVAWSPYGKVLTSQSFYSNTTKCWDPASGTELHALQGYRPKRDNITDNLKDSPDRKMFASINFNDTIMIKNFKTGEELILRGHTDSIESIAWSPDSKNLASGSADKTIKIWNPITGTELRTLRGHTDSITSVAWSPDGKTIASGSNDRTINIWDPATGTVLNTLNGHTASVSSVAFSPDGEILASGSCDRTIRLWIIPSRGDKLLAQMYTIVQAELNQDAAKRIIKEIPARAAQLILKGLHLPSSLLEDSFNQAACKTKIMYNSSMSRPRRAKKESAAAAAAQNSSDDSDFSDQQMAQAIANSLKEQAQPATTSAVRLAEPEQQPLPEFLTDFRSIHEEKNDSD